MVLFLFAERGRGSWSISCAQSSAKNFTIRCATHNFYRRHLSRECANNGSETLLTRVPPPTASPGGFGGESTGRKRETRVIRKGERPRCLVLKKSAGRQLKFRRFCMCVTESLRSTSEIPFPCRLLSLVCQEGPARPRSQLISLTIGT